MLGDSSDEEEWFDTTDDWEQDNPAYIEGSGITPYRTPSRQQIRRRSA